MPNKPKQPEIAKRQSYDQEFFRAHGARGGKLGGKKAWELLAPEQRSARALKAVAARSWHPILTDAEKAERAAIPKRKVGRPILSDAEKADRAIARTARGDKSQPIPTSQLAADRSDAAKRAWITIRANRAAARTLEDAPSGNRPA